MRVNKKSGRKLRRIWLKTFARSWREFKRNTGVCDALDCYNIASIGKFYRCYSKVTTDTYIVSVCNDHKPVPCSVEGCTRFSEPITQYVRRCYACKRSYCKLHKRSFPRDVHTNRRRCCKPGVCYRWGCECREQFVAKCGWRADSPDKKQCNSWKCNCRLNEQFT